MANAIVDRGSPDRTAPNFWLAWAALALSGVGIVAFAWHIRGCLVDDAFTGFQYLNNYLAGRGFVLRAGEPPVEGVTNIGWLLELAPMSAVCGPIIAAKVLGLIFLLAALTLTMLLDRNLQAGAIQTGTVQRGAMATSGAMATLAWPCLSSSTCSREREHGTHRLGARQSGFDGTLAIVPLLLLAANFDFVYFSLAGMETAFLATLLLLMAGIALQKPHSLMLPVLGALACLVHPEAAIVYPLYVLLEAAGLPGDVVRTLRVRKSAHGVCRLQSGEAEGVDHAPSAFGWRRLAVGGLLFALLIGLITAARFTYFHDVVPNTFHSKPSSLWQMVHNGRDFLLGRNTNVAFWLPGWLILVLLWLGYRNLGRSAPAAARMLAAVSTTGILFAVYTKPDWTATARYFVPYLPAALLLSWAGFADAVYRLLGGPSRRIVRRALLGGVATTLVFVGVSDGAGEMKTIDLFPGYVMAGKNLVPPVLWVRDHLPAGTTIATRRIGVLSYYSGHPVFDYTYGLPDREAARLVALHGDRFDVPTEPALADLWQARSPDYLLEDCRVIDAIVASAGGTREEFSIHGLAYRVIKRFPVGHDADWVLAARVPATN